MASKETKTILAIETAVDGGSVALSCGDGRSDGRRIAPSGRASEYVLVAVEHLLTEANIELSSVDHIAVSAGPGSFTGIRIGYATALGLADSMNCHFSSHSLNQAFANRARMHMGTIRSMIATGRGYMAIQDFRSDGDSVTADGEIELVSIESLQSMQSANAVEIVCDQSIASAVSGISISRTVIECPALVIAELANQEPDEVIEPIMLSKSL